jgi:restriction system protein
MEKLPKYQDLVPTLVKVMSMTGQPLTNSEIEARVIQELAIPESLTKIIHSGKRTELQYRLAWARTKAKSAGLISSPARETWRIVNS